MKLIRGLKNLRHANLNSVISIGNFDGFHRGHQLLIEKTRTLAQQHNSSTSLLIFEPQPQEFFSQTPPVRLMRLHEKIISAKQQHIDQLVCLHFDESLADLTAEQFVKQILVDALNIGAVVVGNDFRFGKARSGSFTTLQALGAQYQFSVHTIDDVTIDHDRVSSTRVREQLAHGNIAHANELLGHPFFISGKVIRGDQRGRQLGFPTANIAMLNHHVPLRGVFCVNVTGIDDRVFPAVANLGTRPTVDGLKTLLEVHLLNFDQSIYGQRLCIHFIEKIRDEQRFTSLEALQQQIARDVAHAKHFFG